MKIQACPGCGRESHSYSCIDVAFTPEPGAIGICDSCATAYELMPDGTARAVELSEIPDDDFRKKVQKLQTIIRVAHYAYGGREGRN